MTKISKSTIAIAVLAITLLVAFNGFFKDAISYTKESSINKLSSFVMKNIQPTVRADTDH